MLVLDVRNVNEAYKLMVERMPKKGLPRASRYGDVLDYPDPVTTCYRQPTERVLFDSVRDANPFLHLFESLWMLAGRNDVAWVRQFSDRMVQFSDDGETFHGAYGYRWRRHFRRDQLRLVVEHLTRDPLSRRAVIQIWDAAADLDRDGVDLPCNVGAAVSTRSGKLDLTVYNRSNDMVWGAYGANVVQFSMLQEYLAGQLGVPVGRYWQVSNNFHAYVATLPTAWDPASKQPYLDRTRAVPLPLYTPGRSPRVWDHDLVTFMSWTDEPERGQPRFVHSWFQTTAVPMFLAWWRWRVTKDRPGARATAATIQAVDWRNAVLEWMARRGVAA